MRVTQAVGAVVVGVDGSDHAAAALDWAVEAAQAEHRPLHLIHALERRTLLPVDVADPPVPAHPAAEEEDDVLVAARRRAAVLAPSVRVTGCVEPGSAVNALLEASRTAACVCVGARDRVALAGAFARSTSRTVAATGHCPVVTVRAPTDPPGPAPRVVVGVDGTASSSAAIGYAFQLAALRSLPLLAVHAWPGALRLGVVAAVTPADAWQRQSGEEQAVLGEALAGWSEKYPEVRLSRFTVRRGAVAALLSEAGPSDLLVLGSRGHRHRPDPGSARVGAEVLRRARGCVAVVPAG